MKKLSFRPLWISLLCTALFLGACKKENDDQLEFDLQSSQDNALAEATYSDVNNITVQAMGNGSAGLTTYRSTPDENSLLSNCATVTVSPDSSGPGGNIIVDFGSNNCLCSDYRYRRGIINIRYTGQYRDSGSVITTTFQDYYVGLDTNNMFRVLGSKAVTNKGLNNANHTWFEILVDGQLVNKDGNSMTWISNRQREWIEGESTTGWLNWIDDVYSITGSGSGVNFERRAYTVAINSPLIVALNCRWIKQGSFVLTPNGLNPRTLDYGDGTCDNKASILVNNKTFNIFLR